jgi:16S rRNA processing protein RimM
MAGQHHDRMVCVGQIATAHGVRGLVKLRSFTADPAAIASYGPLSDQSGQRRFNLRVVGEAKDQLIAAVEGIEDRDAAAALRGLRLYVPRERLPEPEDEEEYYLVDLIGLAVETVDGSPFGRVVAIEDYGAGDVVEIALAGKAGTVAAPFTRACFPVVDIAGGRLVIDPPPGLLDRPEPAPAGRRRHG